ncbi:nucleotide exchange factor GrpE [Patescibacteria group bacterium]|nr:nucleotide exchange factor GrpE [Patescibacteria group bacterium]
MTKDKQDKPEDKKKKPLKVKRKSKKEVETDLQEAIEGWRRARADYDNLKKRVASDQVEIIRRANEDLVLDLLPILDNFTHAFTGLSDEEKDNNWVKGFEFIKKQLEDLLVKYQVTEIKTMGEEFDPAKHEAISKEKCKDGKKGEIIKEVKKGYVMDGRIIRAAQVVICQ